MHVPTWNCTSKPSAVSRRCGGPITPALHTSRCSGRPRRRHSSANRRTLARRPKSNSIASTRGETETPGAAAAAVAEAAGSAQEYGEADADGGLEPQPGSSGVRVIA
ncbi:hypothetical protein Vafri_8252 [Volvox africanus]|nr:hypothetical protein Vafri_8252 [Volvox africanus]